MIQILFSLSHNHYDNDYDNLKTNYYVIHNVVILN